MSRSRLSILSLAIPFVLGAGLLASDASAGVEAREQRQRARIRAGVADGTLTRPEALRLSRTQGRIERLEGRMRADGGGIGPYERLRLDGILDRSSARIHRQRHDGQSR
jgi:hypothetical protein